jgi:hypothetical protein
MPLVACPSCGTRLTVTGKTEGRKVYCPCGQTFLPPPREPAPEEVRAELAAVADTMRVVAAVEGVAVTEAEWLACTDPQKMLGFLRGKASDRKLRLFGCACHRRTRHVPGDDDNFLGAVDSLERYADGPVGGWGPAAIERAEEAVISPGDRGWRSINWVEHAASYAVARATWPESYRLDVAVAAAFPDTSEERYADGPVGGWGPGAIEQAEEAARTTRDLEVAYYRAVYAERGEQCRLLRDLFGNPFRPITISPAWQSPQVVALTQAAYDQRELPAGTLDTTRLVVLADALEDAGCTDPPDLLNHLRGPGPHVRGCWAVDLLLGKG